MEIYIIVIVIILIIFAMQSISVSRAKNKTLRDRLDRCFGARPDRTYKYEEYDRIRFYFDCKKNDESIDDITWNDLSMDSIFMLINHTNSSIGEEYLYNMLRNICFDQGKLDEFNDLTEYFLKNESEARNVQYVYAMLGRTKSISFYDFIHRLIDLPKRSSLIHYACIALTLAAVGLFFVNPPIAIVTLILVFAFDIYMYYKKKSDVECYFVCCKYLVALIDEAKNLRKLNIAKLEVYNKRIGELTDDLKSLTKNMFLISDGSMNDSIMGILLEYVKMLFHVDLIKFNSIIRMTKNKLAVIDELYDIMGHIEAAVSIASVKKLLLNEYGAYAKPEIIRDKTENKGIVSFDNLYHPIIPDAVKNSMDAENAVLLTGSNASGKSTFLKTVAINSIFAQTLGFACADSFKLHESLVYSSMALRDDLESNESYYIVEIKSLKRILDKSIEGKYWVMCFIDEVLRGTNTVERIAASSEILEKLSEEKTICFAATHDIELTKILEGIFENYHFEEQVENDQVLFNYELKKGPATTRNAIKLLNVIGYDKKIIDGASNRADEFLNTGVWR